MSFVIITILSPLIAAATGYLRRSSASAIHLTGIAISFVSSLILTLTMGDSSTLQFGGLAGLPFVLAATPGAAIQSVVVSIVGLAIFIYSRSYMADEKGQSWFWPAMSLFVAAMQTLVLAGDWFLFITGWELMGFASYLLIATWHEKATARKGAMRAFLITRFTDIGLYAGVFMIIGSNNSLLITSSSTTSISFFTSLCLLFSVMGKSAQVPFQSWLSEAMAGPTPVSALLHSATMVGAGILLLLRIYPLLGSDALFFTAIVGGVTILLTGLTAMCSRDIKQLLAASTSSQLGFMLLALGTGHPGAALAHWIAHAFMKSSLFLGAGIFQKRYGGTSFDKIRNVEPDLHNTLLLFVIAGAGLAGIPPLIGFWSKDAILSATFHTELPVLFFSIGLAGTFLTGIYIGKVINQLWDGTKPALTPPERNIMQAGMAILVLIILPGGFFLEYLVRQAGYEIPSSLISLLSGLVVTLAGLATGWVWKESWIPGTVAEFIRANYSFAGGYDKIVGQPVSRLTLASQSVEKFLTQYMEKIGTFVMNYSYRSLYLDRGLRWVMGSVVSNAEMLSQTSQALDDSISEKMDRISGLVKKAGSRSRTWQSGMVHQEMAITIASALVLLILLTVTLIRL